MTWLKRFNSETAPRRGFWPAFSMPEAVMYFGMKFTTRTMVLLLLVAPSVFAQHTYYVSKSAGADTHTSAQAQSKSTAWAHMPGMASCTSNCASYSPVAGDTFVLMGCDTWVTTDFPILWDFSGSSGNPITVTVDKTWYNTTACPSTWNRPIFDGQNATITGGAGTGSVVVVAYNSNNVSYGTLDNIEVKRVNGGNFLLTYHTATNIIMSNLYIHAWYQVTDNECPIVQAASLNTFTNGVIDGSDSAPTAGVTCVAFYPTPPNVLNSVIHDLPNAIIGYAFNPGGGAGSTTLTWAGNNVYNTNLSNGGVHGNALETVGGGTYYIYNNLIHHMGNCSGCESMFIGNPGETDYVFNNVIWDLGSAQTPSIGDETGGHTYFYNDTIVATDAQSCVNDGDQGAVSADITVQNVHCIQGQSGGQITDFTATASNVLQTITQADANSPSHFDQYSASQTYVYSPLASTNSTVGAGTNLTSSWPGGISTKDTAYGCTQQTINAVVQAVCPARTTNARPASGAWDAGAYQFSTSTAQAPQPPINLQATVQQ